MCTQDHARNFDIEKLLRDAIGVDHINPRSWEGSAQVGSVTLGDVWRKGQQNADTLLWKQFDKSNINSEDVRSEEDSPALVLATA